MLQKLAEIAYLQAANFNSLTTAELATAFCELGLLEAQLEFLIARWWLNQQQQKLNYQAFISPLLDHELKYNFSHQDFFMHLDPENLKALKKKILEVRALLLVEVIYKNLSEKKLFCRSALTLMNSVFEFENHLLQKRQHQGEYLDFSVYRSFDCLDDIFGIDYQLDQNIKFDPSTKERIYPGAGVGVQSSYSTFLTTLQFLNLPPGGRIIDLGSGYGRLGYIVGCLRPDLNFTGYEYVKERVQQSQSIAANFSLQASIQFVEQDLSADDFSLPSADLYYLYDPFSEATYKKIFTAIHQQARSKKVQIATKGNANFKMQQAFVANSWTKTATFHDGNLCIYLNV